MKREVTTQDELDKAIADGAAEIFLRGNGEFVLANIPAQVWNKTTVYASGSSQVRAYGSSQVRAYDSSQVTAYGSSQVRASDSSQVTASDSSQVTAYGSSQVRAYGSSQVRASKYCAVTIQSPNVKAKGGVQINPPPVKTSAQWCDKYGIDVVKGVVILFKAVRANFKSQHGGDYTPGIVPKAKDWDGGKAECGGGYHFAPTPSHALWFDADAKKFVAVPVRLKDIVVHHPCEYPDKVKAPGGCSPCWEVDINGNKIVSKAEPVAAVAGK